jgi:DNA-binding MarR family transcriptional regulator
LPASGLCAGSPGIDAPNATLVVDDLEDQGLVERRPHPTDRRIRSVAVTARGAAAARKADEIMGRPPVGLTSLSAAQLRVLATTLEAARSGSVASSRSSR